MFLPAPVVAVNAIPRDTRIVTERARHFPVFDDQVRLARKAPGYDVILTRHTIADVARHLNLGISDVRWDGETTIAHRRWYRLKVATRWIAPLPAPKMSLSPVAGAVPSQAYAVVNLPAYSAFYAGPETMARFPVGIVKKGWKTVPAGRHAVAKKLSHPWWIPPANIVKEAAAKGVTLKAKYPPGPTNPMGLYEMLIANETYLHGSPELRSIGRRWSHGCVHFYPRDIKALYPMMRKGSPVYFTDSPVLFAVKHGTLYMQAWRNIRIKNYPFVANAWAMAKQRLARWVTAHPGTHVNWRKAERTWRRHAGFVVPIGSVPVSAPSAPSSPAASPALPAMRTAGEAAPAPAAANART